jgi:hypothetical protein
VVAIALGYTRQLYIQSAHSPKARNYTISTQAVRPGMRIWLRVPTRIIVGTYLHGLPDRLYLSTPGTGAYQTRAIREIREIPSGIEIPEGTATFHPDTDHTFIKGLLPNSDPEDFLSSWDLSIVLVGSPERLYGELAERISISDTPHFWPIGTIVRPIEHSAPVGWRSAVMSARAAEPIWEKFPLLPELIILDGAYATSRWLPDCQASVVVSILERGEPGVEAAVAALMQERSYAVPVTSRELAWLPPDGCELLAFRRPL